MNNPFLKIDNLSKNYGETQALSEISLSLFTPKSSWSSWDQQVRAKQRFCGSSRASKKRIPGV